MKPTSRPNGEAASANITKRIQELGDWRGETLAHVRQLIHDAGLLTLGVLKVPGACREAPS